MSGMSGSCSAGCDESAARRPRWQPEPQAAALGSGRPGCGPGCMRPDLHDLWLAADAPVTTVMRGIMIIFRLDRVCMQPSSFD